VAEAAERAGISARGLRKALAAGRLEGRRDAEGRWHTTAQALARFLAEGNRGRPSGPAGTGAGPGAAQGPELVPAQLLRDLVQRHEAACLQLGQLQAENAQLRSRVLELEAGPVVEGEAVGADAEAVGTGTHAVPRRPWWAPWRRPAPQP
jgi:hypothetical protein